MSQSGAYRGPLEPAGPCQWRIPKSYRSDMRVDGLIFADDTLIEQIKKDQGPSRLPTWRLCRVSSGRVSPCPTSTGVMAFVSAE